MDMTNNSLIPFVIGVSGHRDLDDPNLIYKSCLKTFKRIQGKSADTPKILLCGMATGADQVAAEAALKVGWKVFAVLPMPKESYLDDFSALEQLSLESLLERCEKVIELPLAKQVDSDIYDPRDQQYRNLGIYLLRNVQLMLLCWDGDESIEPAPGGTLEVAKLCRRGIVSQESAIQVKTVDTVWIPTLRKNKAQGKKTTSTKKLKYSGRWYGVLKMITVFNEKSKSSTSEHSKTSIRYLFGIDEPGTELRNLLGAQLDIYSFADSISSMEQKRRSRVALFIISVLFLSLISHGIYSGLSMVPKFLIIHILLLLFTWGLYLWHFKLRRKDIYYLDFRALAEGLRVQIFWQIYGLKNCVSQYYVNNFNREAYWICEAIRNLRLQSSDDVNSNTVDKSILEKSWLESQRNYFIGNQLGIIGKGAFHNKKALLAKNSIYLLLISGIFLTLAALGVHVEFFNINFPAQTALLSNEDLSFQINLLLFLASLSFGLSAGIAMYSQIQGHEERASNYYLVGNLFETALQSYREADGDSEKQSSIILDIGKEALLENAGWLVGHRKATQAFINPY